MHYILMLSLSWFMMIPLSISPDLTSTPEPAFEIKEGTITNLYDAFGKDRSLTMDWGFSCITRYHGQVILFDSGSSADIFQENVNKLGINLKEVDIVVISHSHFDHLNGIDYLLRINPDVRIYFPHDVFWGPPVPFDATGQEPSVKDSLPVEMQYFNGGSTQFTIPQTGRFWNANIEYVKASKEIFPGLKLITTSSAYLGYFSCYPGKSFVPGQFEEKHDQCRNSELPELSLAMDTDKGQVVIVGCSHTGIEKIIRTTLAETANSVDLVYGGFHLLPFNRQQIVTLAQQLKNDLSVKRVAPAHCTGHLAFKILKEQFGENYLYAGLGETIAY